MRLSEFDYNLPKELIAQAPQEPRDYSRLLVYNRKAKETEHRHFYDLVDLLQKGDVLVLNNSKVFPARLLGQKEKTGGKMEVFLHHKIKDNLWQCLVGGRGAKEGLIVEFEQGLNCEIAKNNNDGTWEVRFNKSGEDFMEVVNMIGIMPLPPYIKREGQKKEDVKDYQTAYADDKKIGSVAAPTAGLHFTPRLIKKLKDKGVQFEYITLHVGLGTFAPVKTEEITDHIMHAEWVEVEKNVLKNIVKAKKEGRRVIAVGTTSARTLEALSFVITRSDNDEVISRKKENTKRLSHSATAPFAMTDGMYSGFVDIFIYPGYKFKAIDALITNFHLPKSTLLMLVSAFLNSKPCSEDGIEKFKQLYKTAIEEKYRFYSYGDAMLIV